MTNIAELRRLYEATTGIDWTEWRNEYIASGGEMWHECVCRRCGEIDYEMEAGGPLMPGTDTDVAVAAAEYIVNLTRAALVISDEAVNAAIQQAARENTLVYALDPTLAMRSGASMEDTEKLLRAFRDFQRVAREIRDKEAARR